MEPLEQQMSELREKVLEKVENHLRDYPIGERYFGQLAADQTYIVERLRSGGKSSPATYYKILRFIEEREDLAKNFAKEVLEYLERAGCEGPERRQFGTKVCGSSHLVAKLEAGRLPSIEVMRRVKRYLVRNPVEGTKSAAET